MEHDIAVAFTVLKHELDLVKAEFDAEQSYHIGDTNMDRQYAERARFEFFYPDTAVDHLGSQPDLHEAIAGKDMRGWQSIVSESAHGENGR